MIGVSVPSDGVPYALPEGTHNHPGLTLVRDRKTERYPAISSAPSGVTDLTSPHAMCRYVRLGEVVVVVGIG